MIAFRGLGKRFGSVEAVSALTFEVRRGEVVALLGPNGSGKTTSIKAAAGLIHPTTGDVLIGEPGRPATDPSARQWCSFLPQKVSFPDSLTGDEVVEFYRSLRGVAADRARDVMKSTGLNGAGARAVGTYSGGMTQRLGLAVAMLPRSPVLLLDEPTAALDPDGLCAFYGVIESRRADGQTVLFSSHQMGDVERLADRFVVLVGGRLVAALTSRELAGKLADRGVMKIAIDRLPDGLLDLVRQRAPRVVWAADQLIVPAPAAERVAVLDIVRGSGATIRGLTAEEGRLDGFYHELVGGSK
ncbi:MAG TPA: ABC transporter ATP-binding protein [Vicinamibacterales bacterium]|nr:ABC transporter ATP-binding protein [Vicinamibacterales bacterium]